MSSFFLGMFAGSVAVAVFFAVAVTVTPTIKHQCNWEFASSPYVPKQNPLPDNKRTVCTTTCNQEVK